MSNIILQENTTPRRVQEAIQQQRQQMGRLSGMRELCEDTICPCTNYVHDKNLFKLCKQNCFNQNLQAISECCTGRCPVGQGANLCIESCKNPLQYSTGDPYLDGVTTFSKTANNPGCVLM